MPAHIIDGKAVAQRVTDEVRAKVADHVAAGGAAPGLAVVLVGDSAASQVYVRNKRKTTEAVGMLSFAHDLPATTSEVELLALVDRLNADPAVNGILVQLPLPAHISVPNVLERITPDKLQYIRELVKETNSDEARFLAFAGVKTYEEITTGIYPLLVRSLTAKRK